MSFFLKKSTHELIQFVALVDDQNLGGINRCFTNAGSKWENRGINMSAPGIFTFMDFTFFELPRNHRTIRRAQKGL